MSPHISKLLDQLGGVSSLFQGQVGGWHWWYYYHYSSPPPPTPPLPPLCTHLNGLDSDNVTPKTWRYVILYFFPLDYASPKIKSRKRRSERRRNSNQYLSFSRLVPPPPQKMWGGGSRLLSQPTAAALGNIGFQERGQTDRGQADRIFFRNWGSSLWHFRQ